MSFKTLLPLMVILPLGGAFLALLLGRLWKQAGRVVAFVTTAILLIVAATLVRDGVTGTLWSGGWDPLGGQADKLNFSSIGGVAICLDGLSAMMLFLIAAISTLVAVYAWSYMARYTAQNRFYSLFLLMIAGMNGCVMSGDLFNFFVFLEVASIASYALVGFGTDSEELEAAFKYLVLGSLASTFFLFGVALTWGSLGTLNFGQVAMELGRAGGLAASPVMLLVAGLFIFGLGLKAAMVPFHAWLPDAHPSAPAPISAMLSGLIIKALGVYAIARIFFQVLGAWRVPTLGWVLVSMGVVSMVVGVIMAVGQWDFKRLLAYHSISQMGYVVLALGMAMLLMPGVRYEKLCEREDLIRHDDGVQAGLLIEVGDMESRLSEIDKGFLDPATAGITDLDAERLRLAALKENLASYARHAAARERGLEAIAADKRSLVHAVGIEKLDAIVNDNPYLKLALSLALIGALFHLVNHAFFKSLLFLCAGAIEMATGTRNLKELGGLWKRMPVTSASCAAGALSISGMPPFNGFWSKLFIIMAATLSGHWVLAAVTVAVSFLTLVSFVKVQKYALFGPMSARVMRSAKEVPALMCAAMLILALGCLALGVCVFIVIPELVGPAASSLGNTDTAGFWRTLLGALGMG